MDPFSFFATSTIFLKVSHHRSDFSQTNACSTGQSTPLKTTKPSNKTSITYRQIWADGWGMKFNAKKCYLLSTKSKSRHFYTINDQILKQVQDNPYLGITFSEDLKWKTHINNTSKKANSTLGFLRRNLRHCPLPCRKNAYLALVRFKLEYGSVVWDPYLKNDIDRLERVQRSAARFITGDYKSRHEGCVTNMLDDLDLPSLEERRRQQRLTFLYKVVKGHVPAINIDHYLRAQKPKRTIRAKQFEDFVKKNIVERSVCNNNQCFKQLPAKTEQYRNSFFVRTTHDWNILSDNIVNCDTVESFRTLIAKKD